MIIIIMKEISIIMESILIILMIRIRKYLTMKHRPLVIITVPQILSLIPILQAVQTLTVKKFKIN
jgi:hypothetical protein